MITEANKFEVEDEYIKQAQKLTGQMSGNIKARQTLQMLQAYPERIYPEPEDPAKKKDKKKDAAPKKKKKLPPFPYPEWALDLQPTMDKVKEMELLKDDRDNLQLKEDFIL